MHARRRIAVLAALASCALAGCGALRSWPGPEQYEATLSGTQEVPVVASAGSARAELHLDPRVNLLRWRVTHAGLSGPLTGAHIHGPAGPGENAAVLFPLEPSGSTMAGQFRLSPEQVVQLQSGQWYVNLLTAAHPQGELRGQLRHRPD